MILNQTIVFRLRAAAAVLVLALGFLAPPISLAGSEPDVCEMECCVEEGHCCCAAHHAYVAGQLPKPGEVSLGSGTELTAPCPANCAGASSSLRLHFPRGQQATAHFVTASGAVLAHGQRGALPCSFVARPYASRAPPLLPA
jgi:hypothetical protein